MSDDPQRPVVFLASYPRSGNTFFRGLLANEQSGLDRPLSVEEIARYGAGEKNEALWRACTGASAQMRTLEQEWRARAHYLSLIRRLPGEGPVMFKTHTLNGAVFGLAAFEVRPDDKIIYIVRHPFDVLLSGAAFYGLTLEGMARRLALAGAFNDEGGAAPFEVTGSWTENVSGWLTESRCPLQIVRYDAVLADPAVQLARTLHFLGRKTSAERLQVAADFSSFKTMQASHSGGGFDQGPRRSRDAPFFRVGRSDQWKSEVPAALQAALAAELGALMEVLGFERPIPPDV